MRHDEFVAQVRQRARLSSNEEADLALRATLATFAERLTFDEVTDLISQLPEALAMYMMPPYAGAEESFSLDEFFRRVSEREGVPLHDADFHARIVLGLLAEAITVGEIEDIRAQLPEDFARLLDVHNEGEIPGLGQIAEG